MQATTVLNRRSFSDDKMNKVNLFETANMFCDLYCLKPGQHQKPHSHQGADKVYYVLEGSATIQIGAEEQTLRPGMIVLAPAEIVHGVRNTSDKDVSLLVFMAPNPNVIDSRNK
jgi:quercetin dioxygenase-like cupin family protein